MNDVAPWNVSLPRTLTIGGEERAIRTDYRAALDCFLALGDADLQEHERVCAVLEILYIDPIPPDCIGEAVDRAIRKAATGNLPGLSWFPGGRTSR